MELNGVGAYQTVSGLSGLSGANSFRQANFSAQLNFPESKEHIQKFNQLLKESPLDDRVPTAKSLAKKGYTEDPGCRTPGKTFTDKNDNVINIVGFNNDAGQKSVCVTYIQKNGSSQKVIYDADGNPVKGKIKNMPKAPGDPVEIFEYEFDIEGTPFLTKYNYENPSIHHE